jgi:hypothetical protein
VETVAEALILIFQALNNGELIAYCYILSMIHVIHWPRDPEMESGKGLAEARMPYESRLPSCESLHKPDPAIILEKLIPQCLQEAQGLTQNKMNNFIL